MDGKFGKVLLAAILCIASWTAWRVDHRPDAGPHAPITTAFTDAHGKQHTYTTLLGEIRADETTVEHIARHLRDVKTLEDATQ